MLSYEKDEDSYEDSNNVNSIHAVDCAVICVILELVSVTV